MDTTNLTDRQENKKADCFAFLTTPANAHLQSHTSQSQIQALQKSQISFAQTFVNLFQAVKCTN